MTTYNKQTLGTYFETGDVPTGTDFQNLIDSQVNIVETSTQAMAGPLSTTELITSRISAGNIFVTGTFSAANISVSAISVTGTVSAAAVNVTGDISAVTGTVYASALRMGGGGIFRTVTIVSAAGTAQATGAPLGITGIIRGKGIVDGSTTGFTLLANQTGLQQTIYVEENTSCNLWPCVGGQINALSSNAAFGMAGNSTYIITHIKASGYSVK